MRQAIENLRVLRLLDRLTEAEGEIKDWQDIAANRQAEHAAMTKALTEAEGRAERADELKDALHDLVALKAQDDIGCVPPPTKDQWEKAWAEAEELVRVEP